MTVSVRALRVIALVASLALLAACTPEEKAVAPDPVRAVKTQLVETRSPTQERAFPAVLEPLQITPLAFEVGGRLGTVDLQIGQRVEAGAVLMRVGLAGPRTSPSAEAREPDRGRERAS